MQNHQAPSAIREMKIKATLNFHLTVLRLAILEKRNGEDLENEEQIEAARRNVS